MNSTAETPTILLNCSVTDAVVLYKERVHHLARTKKPSHLPQNATWSGTACPKQTVPVDHSSTALVSVLRNSLLRL